MSGVRVDRTTVGALIAAAVTTALLVTIGARHIVGYDSFWHVFIARQDRWAEFWREVAANAHPPLYYLLLRGVIRVLGYSLLVYRLISIVAIAVSTVLIGRIVQRLTASPPVAIVAVAAFAFSSSAADLGLEVRAYALNLALMLSSFLLFVDWIAPDSPGVRAWKRWLFALTVSAAIVTHYSAAFFLAAAGLLIVVLGLCHARWRQRLYDELRRHPVSAVAMFAVPGVVLVLSHMIHAGAWTGHLSHIPAFMFNPQTESPYRFLDRATPALVALFFPDTGIDLPIGWIATVIVVVLLALSARAAFRGEITAMPMLLFAVMLVLNAVAAIAERYPFGGALRHESFLFPFLVIAFFVGLDSVRRALPSGWASQLWVGVAAILIGVNAASWLSQFRLETSPMMTREMELFRRSVGTPDALFVDQFNLITVFAHYHDRTWRLHRDRPEGGVRQVWDVTRGTEHLKVCRSFEWLADPLKPSLYADVARCLERGGVARAGLFRPKQGLVYSLPLPAGVESNVVSLAAEAGLSADTLVVRDGDVFAGFQVLTTARQLQVLSATYGGSCGATAGNVTAPVKAACERLAGCTFLINVAELGDPAPGCAKDFEAVWTCGGGEPRRAAVPAEAGFGSTVRLVCPQ
jgi:hypothetical protein